VAIIEVSLILVSDSAIISGGLEHGVTISSSLSIFLCKDLMLQCSKERSFDINLSIWLTKSVCVACAAAFEYIQSIKSDVTKGLIQVGNLAERGPLANFGDPLANTQKRT